MRFTRERRPGFKAQIIRRAIVLELNMSGDIDRLGRGVAIAIGDGDSRQDILQSYRGFVVARAGRRIEQRNVLSNADVAVLPNGKCKGGRIDGAVIESVGN